VNVHKQTNTKKQQATSNKHTTMASRSTGWMYSKDYGQHLPNTFNKLSSFWSGKVGKRDHTANIFYNTSLNEPKAHVPFLLMTAFNRIHHDNGTMVSVFKNINPSSVKTDENNEAIWIYTMRQSDALPKTTQDLERVYAFVRMFAEQYLDVQTHDYIMSHINIAVCFFIWFFTTPNFFFNKKEVKQTTRGGIQKMWRSILLIKPPVQHITHTTTHKRGVNHQTNILSNLEKEKKTIQNTIVNTIKTVHTNFSIDWDDNHNALKTISNTMQSNNQHYIPGKKGKKIQKLYQDYQKITDKIKMSKKSISSVNSQQNKMSLTIKVPETNDTYDWGPLGPPPSPPKLIRQNAYFPTFNVSNTNMASPIVDTPLPLTDEIIANPVEDVPESWEDL